MVLSKGSKRSWSASALFLPSMLDNWLFPTVSVPLLPQCICSFQRFLRTIFHRLRSFYKLQLAFGLRFRFIQHSAHVLKGVWALRVYRFRSAPYA